MAKFIQQNHSISTMIKKVLVVVVMLLILFGRVIPQLASSCNMMFVLIKQRPFIHIFVNFIIISLLTSSSFSLVVLKFQPRRQKHTSVERTTSHVIPFFGDDDTWWVGIIEDTEPVPVEPAPAATWNVEEEEEEVEVEREEQVIVDEQQTEEGEGTLDETWKAIMEAKSKGGGPPLKKSGTWSHGDRGSGGDGGLKRWRTLKDGGGGKAGGGGEWKKEVSGLTYHDEFKNRADAFIAQFFNNMRLQRLESDQRFVDMINRGH